MKHDEFAFFNQQLAAMLRTGIPLEGALRQLCADMQRGTLRSELESLAAALAQGIPLREAVARGRLPKLYVQMLTAGAAGNNLPAMLTLLADYYHRRHALWTRLKALMVYPMIVLVAALALSVLLAAFFQTYARSAQSIFSDVLEGRAMPGYSAAEALIPFWWSTSWLALVLVLVVLAFLLPSWRDWLRWRLPGFRESSLSQLAATLKLLVGGGGSLGESLRLLREVEQGSRLANELDRWQQRLERGQGRFAAFAGGGRLLPPFFLWLVDQGGEDLAGGFGNAAQVYAERARHRVEMVLYAALPVMVGVLGLLVLGQLLTMMRVLGGIIGLMDSLGG